MISQFKSMRRKLFVCFTLGATALAATLLAQTSPWPFPPRPGATPQTSSSSPFSPRSAATTQTSTGRNLTVAFWNIAWFPGGRPNAYEGEEWRQINAVHREIAQLKPDIIGMEEVRDFASAGLAVEKLPGFKADVCANFPPREGQKEAQQVAIASRLQPLSAWAELWKPAGPLLPPRGFAFAAYEVAPRQLLLVYCVHFKSNQGNLKANISMRQESGRQLHSHMADMEQAYRKLGTIAWVIGGDFNTSLDDARFAEETTLRSLIARDLAWIWQNVPLANRTTLPGTKNFPPACFDHIFYRGLKLQRAWVADTTRQASDHRAIAATFDLPSAGR
jgi:endonuclease/exonuclease/phosphatase family metal-dependent hydrolase